MTGTKQKQKQKVLVPVRVLEGEAVAQGVVEFLSTTEVLILGYHDIPEQTAPGQARMQFEERAQTALGELAEEFEEAGADTETLLVFTHDEEESFDRVSSENGCDARLINSPVADVEKVLVPLRGEIDVAKLTGFVGGLVAGRGIGVTLYATGEGAEGTEEARERVSSVAESLRGAGTDDLDEVVEETTKPIESIAALAAEHDAVIMGEGAPSLSTLVFGEESERVADRFHGPVVVVERGDRGGEREDEREDEREGAEGDEGDGGGTGSKTDEV